MARSLNRKDSHGNVLRKGESQRKDQRYIYQYTDRFKQRHVVYANNLPDLRLKEKEILRDQLEGIEHTVAEKTTVNDLVSRYLELKPFLRDTTRIGYQYMYRKFVQDGFGKLKISEVRFSDVTSFYLKLIVSDNMAPGTVENIHNIIHPAFDLAVRDSLIRNNPSDNAMRDIKKGYGHRKKIRHPLTIEQQREFFRYINCDPVFCKWVNLFTVMFGTGMRISEAAGLCWQDVDFEHEYISVERQAVELNGKVGEAGRFTIHDPKTVAGIRKIPMLKEVKRALEDEYQIQKELGFNKTVLEGVTGFVFQNRFGNLISGHMVNDEIHYIVETHNEEEISLAAKEKRELFLLPHFSCHIIRHTFATRLCENESNLKAIQSIMGHANIETTMDIYAEATERKKKDAIEKIDETDGFF